MIIVGPDRKICLISVIHKGFRRQPITRSIPHNIWLISVAETLDAICDPKSLKLFVAISVKGLNSEDLSVQLELSPKEFYSRMSRLIRLGMVKRKNKKHFLTAFGKIVYDGHITIKKAAENDYKLRAIDSMDLSSDLTKYERNKLIDSLLDDKKIKDILTRDLC
jgi:hypothetical protein